VTGPEHHREAERLIELAREAGIKREIAPTRITLGGGAPRPPDYGKFYTDESSDPKVRSLLADAQVHATLALAAATVALGKATASPPPPRHVTLRPDPGDEYLP
jgi:hypothetical protein